MGKKFRGNCILVALAVFIIGIIGIVGIVGFIDNPKTVYSLDNNAGIGSGELKPITLSYWCPLPLGISDLSKTEIYMELEKKTGIQIEFIYTPVSEQPNRFALMVAAADLPDMVDFPVSSYPELLKSAVRNNAVKRLNDLIKASAPNLNSILEANIDIKKQIAADDGGIYFFPSLNMTAEKVNIGPILRTDLLKKTGFEVPVTIDDWEKLLAAFKAGKLCKTPLTFDISTFDKSGSFISAFDSSRGFYQENGRVAYGPAEPQYRFFIGMLNRWYKQGLLDPEFLLMKNNQVLNKAAKGDVGAFIGTASDLDIVQDALLKVNPEYVLEAVPNPVLIKSEKLSLTYRTPDINPTGNIMVSGRNRYPVETVAWLDYVYGEEGHRLCSYGIEGSTYTMEDGKPKYTGLILSNPEGLTVSQASNKYLRLAAPGYIDENLQVYSYKYSQSKAASKIWSSNSDTGFIKRMPPVSQTHKELFDSSTIMKDLSTYTLEMFAKFVLGVESFDNYEKYVKNIIKMGAGKVIDIMQAPLYRYENRLPENSIKVLVNNSPVEMDTLPVKIGGTLMVPVRFPIEALGGSVEWVEPDKSINILIDGCMLKFRIGSGDSMINNERKNLEAPAMLLNDRTYIPYNILSDIPGLNAVIEDGTVRLTKSKWQKDK